MSFQAPFDIMDMRRLQMAEAQAKQAQQMQSMEQITSAITGLAGAYAEGQATAAKGKAYGEFLGMHGQQLGFDPNWLDEFKKKKPYEQAMIGDNIIGMQNAGNWLVRDNYASQYLTPRGGSPGGAGAGGGAPQKGYQVGQGWVGYGGR